MKSEVADQLALGSSLGFLRELWALDHALERTSVRMQSTHGVTAQQRMLLRVAGTYPGITAGQLARVLHVDPGTLSASIRRLEERGLLERRRDPRDKRRVTIGLTADGRTLDVKAPGTVEHTVDAVLRVAEPAEIAAARALLARLTRALDDAGDHGA